LWPWRMILADLGDEQAVRLLAPEAADVDPEWFARFDAITRSLAATVSRRPALIVLDDVHVADPATLILVRLIARSADRLPMLLLFAGRTGGADFPASPGMIRLALARFDRVETKSFLDAYDALPADGSLTDALFQLTGGHPLHLQRFALQPSERLDVLSPGTGVHAAVAIAVAGLPAPTRNALQAAAIVGMSPSIAEVAAVAEVSADVLYREVASAQRAGLVITNRRLRFSHEVLRDVLLDGLGAEDSRKLHARAAKALATSARLAPENAVRLAHHALRAAALSAAHARAAVAACRHAAESLARGFGYEQAAELLADAVDVHEQAVLPDPFAVLLVEWAEAVLRGDCWPTPA
jgi:hypothetical protein